MGKPGSAEGKCGRGGGSVPLCLRFALLFFLSTPILPASAQTLPLDDKARYERSLETKVEEVLFRLLGPNQAKVVV
ncbi:MAG: hypothetical protein WC204_11470, partial [Elusimicrobiales bacterium]